MAIVYLSDMFIYSKLLAKYYWTFLGFACQLFWICLLCERIRPQFGTLCVCINFWSIRSEVTRQTVVLVETVKYSATRIRVLIPSIILGYTPLRG